MLTLVTGHHLNGHNYLQWSQSVLMNVCGKGREEYLTDQIEVPKKDDPKYKSWKIDNYVVMYWLVNSMTTEIGKIFLYMELPRKFGTLRKKHILAQKTHLNYSK